MNYDVIIIGAGASGLYCAAHLSEKKVLIIEKNKRIGLKLLASGNGQCNLTHGGYINAFYEHYGARKSFVKSSLSVHSNKSVIEYFESQGVPCMERADGKVFPESLKSIDVLNGLKKGLGNVKFALEERAVICSVELGGFEVVTDKGTYHTCNLVISTGGKSYPSLGTSGDGYALAKLLGHHITQIKPGLTGVVTRTKEFESLQGVSAQDVEVTLNGKETKTRKYQGTLLFTHFGLSGPMIINNSRDFDKNDILTINFLNEPKELVEKHFLSCVNLNGDKPIAFYLNLLKLPEALKNVIFESKNFDRQSKLSGVTKVQRKWLMNQLTAYPVEIESLIGFNQAMVTVGGVGLEEINFKTMESLLHQGLYFIGEVLDVDGDTGGYNLQWAFSSGYSAAQAINK